MTVPGSSPNTVPDLAALALAHDSLYLRALQSAAEAIRHDAEAATSHRALVGRDSALLVSDTIPEYLAVLSFVDDLRAENKRLREYVSHRAGCVLLDDGRFGPKWCSCGLDSVLAGSPAANNTKEV